LIEFAGFDVKLYGKIFVDKELHVAQNVQDILLAQNFKFDEMFMIALFPATFVGIGSDTRLAKKDCLSLVSLSRRFCKSVL
jgi:hypothetical protein